MKLRSFYRGVRRLLGWRDPTQDALVDLDRLYVTNGRALVSVPVERDPDEESQMWVSGALLDRLCSAVTRRRNGVIDVRPAQPSGFSRIQQRGSCATPRRMHTPYATEEEEEAESDAPTRSVLPQAVSYARKTQLLPYTPGVISLSLDAQTLRDLADALGAEAKVDPGLPVTLVFRQGANTVSVYAGRSPNVLAGAGDAFGILNAQVSEAAT